MIVVNDNYTEKNGTVLTCEQWCEKTYGGIWKQTSYNTYQGKHKLGGIPLRKNYAGIGYIFDKNRDAFIGPQPFPSWKLNEETCTYEAPILKPDDGKRYYWDESSLSWIERKIP